MLKFRNSLLVTLTAVVVLVATCSATLANTRGTSPTSSPTSSVVAKPNAQPTAGEPEAGGGGAPLPKNEVPRMGMFLILPDLDPELFWQWLVQWLTELAAQSRRQY